MNNFLGYFIVIEGREYFFKPTMRNESLHDISNDNGVRVVTFAISKMSLSKVHCSHMTTFINVLGHLLMERLINKIDCIVTCLTKGNDRIQDTAGNNFNLFATVSRIRLRYS
jgi:hypothetical protein